MKHNSFFRRAISILIAATLVIGLSFGQNLVIGSNSVTVGGNGTINVKGNIVNTGVTSAVTVGGASSTVNLNSTNPQSIGGGSGALNFATLRATAVSTKTINTDVSVATALNVTSAGLTQIELAAAKTLTIAGTIANGGGATTPYKFNNATSVVDYSGTASQDMWGASGFTYTNLTMSGSGGFTMQGNITVSATTNQSGSGALTVGSDFVAGAGYTFGTITSIAAAKSLTLGTTGTIATLTDIAATGSLINGTGALTIATLTDNHGTITSVTNDGAITFTNAAANTGDITGGAGTVTFSNTLAHSTGTISSNEGTVLFSGSPTFSNSAIITAGTGGTLDFNAAIIGTSGTLSLTGSGIANIAQTFTTVPTLSFAGTSVVNYDGAAQNIPAATYVNLNMIGSGTKTALGTITATNFDNGGGGNLAITTDMGTQTLTISTGKENTNGTILFGGLTNGVLFTTGTINYNAAAGTQTIAGGGTYETLLLTVGGTKQIAAATTVGTSAGLTVAAAVTLDLAAVDSQLDVAGDLTVNGFLTNAGTINVGP